MKLIFIVLVASMYCHASTEEDTIKQWTEFQQQFGKTYKSPLETRKRFGIFKDNLEKIESHNLRYDQGLETYVQGITQFADWTSEEFLAYIGKYQEIDEPKTISKLSASDDLPDLVDWRVNAAVTAVKDQGRCGSCWAFAATGAIEGQLALNKSIHVSLSEQNLVDCAEATQGIHGCDGNSMVAAYHYAKSDGIVTEASYPYVGRTGTCKKTKGTAYKIHTYNYVEQNEDALKQAVATIGPIATLIEANSNLQHYRFGIYYDNSCKAKLNHGVLTIGYGTDNGKDYWLIKNTWGWAWGENGYFRMARNRENNCGLTQSASYPIL